MKRKKHAERKICWRITRHCNLHCLHCLAGHANAVRSDLGAEDRYSALQIIAECGVTRITWTGGEPTLCPDLQRLLMICHEYSIVSVLTTHGLALRQNLLESLDPSLDRIRFSFDGLETTHNIIRGGNVFKKAFRVLCDVYKNGYVVEANISILEQNIMDIPELITVLADAGVSKIVLLNLMHRESAVDNCIERPSSQQLQRLIDSIRELRVIYPNIVIQYNDYWNPTDAYIVIESNGEILLCSEVKDDLTFGNIIGSSGLGNLGRALKYQTLEHRTPLESIPESLT